MKTEMEELQQENKKITAELDKIIGTENPIYSPLWVKIGELVANEIELEKFCNE